MPIPNKSGGYQADYSALAKKTNPDPADPNTSANGTGQAPSGMSPMAPSGSGQELGAVNPAMPGDHTGQATASGSAKYSAPDGMSATSPKTNYAELGSQIPSYEPKAYESVGNAGSGFINLTHLLGLNRASGSQSAKDLENKTREAGLSAQKGINDTEASFNAAADAGTPNINFSAGSLDADAQIASAKNAAYAGPNDLTGQGSYADLAKKVGQTQDQAKGLANGQGNLAAEVQNMTGLSPTQAAASAYYMGGNNENLKSVGRQFSNLQNALDAANSRAMNRAAMGRQTASNYQNAAGDWQNQQNNVNDIVGHIQSAANAQAAQDASNTSENQRNDIIKKNDQNAHDQQQIHATSDINQAVAQGVPYELALKGMTYADWVAAGKPKTEQEYQDRHGGKGL